MDIRAGELFARVHDGGTEWDIIVGLDSDYQKENIIYQHLCGYVLLCTVGLTRRTWMHHLVVGPELTL